MTKTGIQFCVQNPILFVLVFNSSQNGKEVLHIGKIYVKFDFKEPSLLLFISIPELLVNSGSI